MTIDKAITRRGLVTRVRRKLREEGHQLHIVRSRDHSPHGPIYTTDIASGEVILRQQQLEPLARDLGILGTDESVGP